MQPMMFPMAAQPQGNPQLVDFGNGMQGYVMHGGMPAAGNAEKAPQYVLAQPSQVSGVQMGGQPMFMNGGVGAAQAMFPRPAAGTAPNGQQYVLVEMPASTTPGPTLHQPYGMFTAPPAGVQSVLMPGPMMAAPGGFSMYPYGGQIPVPASSQGRRPQPAAATNGKTPKPKATAPVKVETPTKNGIQAALNPMAVPFMPGSTPAAQPRTNADVTADGAVNSSLGAEQKLANTVRVYLRSNCAGGSVSLAALQSDMEAQEPEACRTVITRWTEFCLHNSIKVFTYTDAEIEAHKLTALFEHAGEQRVTLVENAHYIDADRNIIAVMTSHQPQLFEFAKSGKSQEEVWPQVLTAAQSFFEGAKAPCPLERNLRVIFRNLVRLSEGNGVNLESTIPSLMLLNMSPPADKKDVNHAVDEEEKERDLQSLVNALCGGMDD
jgi:hypothetical protein